MEKVLPTMKDANQCTVLRAEVVELLKIQRLCALEFDFELIVDCPQSGKAGEECAAGGCLFSLQEESSGEISPGLCVKSMGQF